jgi:mannose-6-phosphate isomerase-like protein (cupin superfamily)
MELEYVRIYGDADGESHFEDVAMPLVAADLAPPVKPMPLSAPIAAARLLHFRAPQDLDGSAWHPAPKRQFMYVLSGTAEITVSDGETRSFGPGSILLVEDVTGKGHSARRPDPDGYTAALVQLD